MGCVRAGIQREGRSMWSTERGEAAANAISMALEERAALVWGKDVVVFDNNADEDDPRTRRVVGGMVRWAKDSGMKVRGFGFSRGGHTWALVLRPRCKTRGLLEIAHEAIDVLWGVWCGESPRPQELETLAPVRPVAGPGSDSALSPA
jgi:hypothetical protein